MNGKMDHNNIGPLFTKAFYRSFSPVAGTVIHYPEYPLERSIRLLAHYLIYESIKGANTIFYFQSSKYLCPSYIPSGKIGLYSLSYVFMFYTRKLTRLCAQAMVPSFSGLYACFLIGRDYIISLSQGFSLPEPSVEV
jgi:hypothetical protein